VIVNLAELAAEFALREIPSDDLKDRAYQSVLAGYDSPSLSALAGAEKCLLPGDVRDLFCRALGELGVPVPNRLEAGAILKRVYAQRVVDHVLSPREGASRIVGLFHRLEGELPKVQKYVGDPFGIARLLGSYYQLDDAAAHDPTIRRQLEEEIVEACSRLARGEDAND
jgi:hypothetical protein